MKSSNRWADEILDKSEEIIKSFSEKNKMTVFLGKEKRYHHDPLDSIRYYKHFYNQD
jgi:hypothetical protein